MHIDKAVRSAFEQYNNGNIEQAEAICKKILKKKHSNVDALNLLGMISYLKQDYSASADYIETALRYDTSNFQLLNNLGTAYKAEKKLDDAINCYRKALLLNPLSAAANNNLGSVLQEKRDVDGAMECYQAALRLDPQYADAYFNLGTALRVKGRIDEAIAHYQKALHFNPNFVEAYNNLGVDFKERGNLREALIYFQKVLELRPSFAEAYNNIGSILGDQGKLGDAEGYYRRALQLNPDFAVCHSNLLLSMNYSTHHDNRTIYQEHLNFANQFAVPLSSGIPAHTNECTSDRPLRIGYVSPDFRRHSVNYFVEPVLEAHNRDHFEVFCYSDVISPDEVTGRMQTYPLQWRDIVGMPDGQVASLVRADKIDILVDLAGHTAHNRILLFARKPTPVQVTWLGYPNTTGLSTVDYRIVDNFTDPPGVTDPFYSEKLVRMPESFLCYNPERESPEIGPLPSLQAGHITFGSFNIISKVTPEAAAIWSHILKEVPYSKLLLKAKSLFDKGTREYLGELFHQQGITPERLIFKFHTASYKEHLAMYNDIDIALDTFPYNGTTTTCEALWMGVPVVTLAGDRHASRVGMSLLSNIGIPELIAETGDAYVEIATDLARNTGKLRFLRAELRSMLTRSPLSDTERFTKHLEQLYREMWQTYCGIAARGNSSVPFLTHEGR